MSDNRYRQLCFNELTLEPECAGESETYLRVKQFAETIKAAKSSLDTKMIRYDNVLSGIHLSHDITLQEFCARHKREPWVILIMSTFTMPQVHPDDTESYNRFDSIDVKAYSQSSRGFASAYVYQTSAIGLCSEARWNNVIHDIEIIYGSQSEKDNWPCLTSPLHTESDEFREWKENHEDLQLRKTTLKFEEKKVSLRDDHGKDVLLEHATVLCRSEYVEGILTSLKFKRKSRSYIDRITPDGIVDIVLFRTDDGYSMRVKTTGRNIRETNAIAEELKKLY